MTSRRETIISEIADRVSDILYYRRQEDEELPPGSIGEAVRQGEITVDEMVQVFREELEQGLSTREA